MKFVTLAGYLETLEKTSSRNDITEILSKLFKEADKDEIDKIVYLVLGILAPAYRGLVFNVAEKMMVAVVAQTYDKDSKEITALYKTKGDLGDVAADLAQGKAAKLTVSDVYDTLTKIAEDEGEGSQERKVSGLAKLLGELDPVSVKYVTRIPVGKLRLGFSDKTIIDALSFMVAGDKSAKKDLENAYQVLPDVGLLAKNVKTHGLEKATKDPVPVVGIPVMPMLAQRLNTTSEMVKKMGKLAVEAKFDGLRVLIHYAKNKNGKEFIKAFTRNLNEISDMFPELQHIGKYIDADEVILDSEGVGVDPKTERIVDFQKTISRRRKHDIGQSAKDIPLRFQVFDIMAKNGKNLMNMPYQERRKELKKTIKKNKFLQVDDYLITEDPEVIRKEHKKLRDAGLEGIIAKRFDARYVPGRTGWRWVKMKEEEGTTGMLPDTVDCVVMGYTKGKGKRAGFGVGQFLAGIKDGAKYTTITKVGTGLTDDQFKELAKRLEKLQVKEGPKEYEITKDLTPDFFVKPSLVVELAADEITKSPRHSSGYALRFPRLVKFRDDKSAHQATTLKEIQHLFKLQKS